MLDPALTPQAVRSRQLQVIHAIALEVSRRRADDVVGIGELFVDNVFISIGRKRRGTLGLFSPESWQLKDSPVSEITLFADRAHARPNLPRGEDMFVTLVHELAHVYSHYVGIKDTSSAGKYHNRRFGAVALALGLTVERSGDYRGHITPGIAKDFVDEYSDLIMMLDQVLVLRVPSGARAPLGGGAGPKPGTQSTEPRVPPSSKYMFASCACRSLRDKPRTIRIAIGSWQPDSIVCGNCGRAFAQESLSRTS